MPARDRGIAARLIYTYVAGWREHDPAKVLGTLAPNCVIVESYGPMYRGVARVARWLDAWFGEGNTVDRWEITSLLASASGVTIEWRFACSWRGEQAAFEGASIARFRGNKIVYLREYATTAPLYDWDGLWRP